MTFYPILIKKQENRECEYYHPLNPYPFPELLSPFQINYFNLYLLNIFLNKLHQICRKMSGRNFADWLLSWAHRVPHFDFRFHRLRQETPFDIDPNGEYAQVRIYI